MASIRLSGSKRTRSIVAIQSSTTPAKPHERSHTHIHVRDKYMDTHALKRRNIHTYSQIHTHLYTYIHTMTTCIHTYMHTYITTYIPSQYTHYTHTYTHNPPTMSTTKKAIPHRKNTPQELFTTRHLYAEICTHFTRS